jgi:hypothetical protein
MNYEILKRIFVVVFSTIAPFLIHFTVGPIDSISKSWNTDMQPVFILTNAMVSYFFFGTKHWQIPGISLLLLTALSINYYPSLHNAAAAVFFISSAIGLLSLRKFRYYLWIYLASVPVGLFTNLYWFETFAILVLCVYHLHVIIYGYLRVGDKLFKGE